MNLKTNISFRRVDDYFKSKIVNIRRYVSLVPLLLKFLVTFLVFAVSVLSLTASTISIAWASSEESKQSRTQKESSDNSDLQFFGDTEFEKLPDPFSADAKKEDIFHPQMTFNRPVEEVESNQADQNSNGDNYIDRELLDENAHKNASNLTAKIADKLSSFFGSSQYNQLDDQDQNQDQDGPQSQHLFSTSAKSSSKAIVPSTPASSALTSSIPASTASTSSASSAFFPSSAQPNEFTYITSKTLLHMLRKGGKGVTAESLEKFLKNTKDANELKEVLAITGSKAHNYEGVVDKCLRHERFDLATVLIKYGAPFEHSLFQMFTSDLSITRELSISKGSSDLNKFVISMAEKIADLEVLNYRDIENTSLLMKAVKYNNMELVKIIIGLINKENQKINKKVDTIEATSLVENTSSISASGISTSSIGPNSTNSISNSRAINSKKDNPINQRNKYGDTALTWALKCKNPSLEIIDMLVSAGADVNHKVSFKGVGTTFFDIPITSLYQCARNGQAKLVAILLKSPTAEVNILNSDGNTAYKSAATRGYWEIMEMLASKGANIDQGNNNGITPLLTAMENGHYDTASKLIKMRVNINQVSRGGDTALSLAVKRNAPGKLIEELMERGADPNSFANFSVGKEAKNVLPVNIIRQVVRNKQSEIAIPMIRSGKVDFKLPHNQQLITSALFHGAVDIATELLKIKPTINLEIKIPHGPAKGQTPLLCAINFRYFELAKSMLELGAKVDVVDSNGDNALTIALKKNAPLALLESLIEKGVDPNIKVSFKGTDSTNFDIPLTPLYQVARNHQNEKVAVILKSKTIDLNIKNSHGQTVLRSVAAKGFKDIIDLLIHRADSTTNVSTTTFTDILPLSLFSQSSLATEPSSALPTLSALPAPSALSSSSALSSNSVVNNLRPLLKLDLDITDDEGNTPLMAAIDSIHFGTAEKLINLGANVKIKRKDGNTALTLAKTRKAPASLIELLSKSN